MILPRRKLLRLAAPALVLPHRRAEAQVGLPWPGPGGVAAAAGAAWTLIATASVNTPAGGDTFPLTTSAVDTSTANALVATMDWYGAPAVNPVLSDSKGNTWTQATQYGPGGSSNVNNTLYALPPTVGTGHTFTVSCSATVYASLIVFAFKSATGTPFYDFNGGAGNNANISSGTTLTVTSITPGHANDLVLSSLCENTNGNTYTIDSGYTRAQISPTGGGNTGLAFGWAIHGTTATSPTWTFSLSTTIAQQTTFILGS